jgi:hypothetical protein
MCSKLVTFCQWKLNKREVGIISAQWLLKAFDYSSSICFVSLGPLGCQLSASMADRIDLLAQRTFGKWNKMTLLRRCDSYQRFAIRGPGQR